MALYNAYEARTLKAYNLESLRASLELAASAGQTIKLSDEIQYVVDTSHDVKPFPIPVRFGDVVYVDARTFASVGQEGELKVRNPVEHQLRLDQARWEIVWGKHDGRWQVLMAQFPAHHEVFGKWFGDILSHTYALTPYQSAQVQMLAGLFSVGQFANNVTEPLDVMRLMEQISRELRFDKAMFEQLTGHLPDDLVFPRDMSEFVTVLHKSEISTRLDPVTELSMAQATANSFFGVSNEKPLCFLANEYPPALLCMMAACLRNNMFNRTRIAGIVNKSGVAKNKDRFLTTYDRVLAQYTKPIKTQG